MPFKSEAQRRKFAELVKAGKMSQATFDEWERETKTRHLPERLHPKRSEKFTQQQNKQQTKKG